MPATEDCWGAARAAVGAALSQLGPEGGVAQVHWPQEQAPAAGVKTADVKCVCAAPVWCSPADSAPNPLLPACTLQVNELRGKLDQPLGGHLTEPAVREQPVPPTPLVLSQAITAAPQLPSSVPSQPPSPADRVEPPAVTCKPAPSGLDVDHRLVMYQEMLKAAGSIGADSSDLEVGRAGGYDGWRARQPRQWGGCWEGGACSSWMDDGCGCPPHRD